MGSLAPKALAGLDVGLDLHDYASLGLGWIGAVRRVVRAPTVTDTVAIVRSTAPRRLRAALARPSLILGLGSRLRSIGYGTNGTVVRGLGFEYYATSYDAAQSGALQVDCQSVTVEDNTVNL